jgi:phosphoglycerate dehydrogenase-like enzyme
VSETVDQPLRLLLSQQALAQQGAAIAQVFGARAYELVTIEQAVAGARSDIDLAFISRDVTGLSTKHELAPGLQACYAVLRRSQGLRWVHIHSAGADRDIYVELRARGVSVSTSSGANAEVVAQTALAGLLALARRFPQLMAAQREHRWAPLIGSALPRDLGGQTAVLVGWGPIGQRIGAFLRLLGLRLVVVRTRATPPQDGIEFVGFGDLPAVLPRADWLLLACPLTPLTRGLVDARALAALPRGAGLINVARGEVVVEADLIAALRAGQLGGAFLDVYEHEPLPAASPLWDLPNVIAMPHSAGHSDGNAARVAAMFLDNLGRWCAGQALRNLAR